MEEPKINTIELKKEKKQQYYLKNKDVIQARNKAYYSKHKDTIIQQICERVSLNPELKKKQNTNYYISNKDHLNEQAKSKYINNKETILLRMKMKYQSKKTIPVDNDIFIDSE